MGPEQPQQYAGRRRAPGWSPWEQHPRLVFVAVLLVTLSVVVLLRGLATGAPARLSEATVGESVGPERTDVSVDASPVGAPSAAVTSSQRVPASSTVSPTPSRTPTKTDPPAVAVPPTASPPPPPTPVTLSYEAEAVVNTRPREMDVRDLPAASGGKYVGNVGNNRVLRFNGVAAGTGGDYALTVHYMSAEQRTGWLRANNGVWQPVTFPPTGGWDKVGVLTLTVELLVGTNTVEIGNAPGRWAPDLDRITVR